MACCARMPCGHATCEEVEKMRTADWIVIALGALVSAIGYSFLPMNWAWFVLGFGVAHIILGALDLVFRTEARAGN